MKVRRKYNAAITFIVNVLFTADCVLYRLSFHCLIYLPVVTFVPRPPWQTDIWLLGKNDFEKFGRCCLSL
jgi:hypothetical protein